jgi:hypothetical protein
MIVTRPLMIVENMRQHCSFFTIVISTRNSLTTMKSKFSISLYHNIDCKISMSILLVVGIFEVASYYSLSPKSHTLLIFVQCC